MNFDTNTFSTFEARTIMRDLALAALRIVRSIESGVPPTPDHRIRIREMVAEARNVLTDAGYPGEGVWRELSRASMGIDTLRDEPDPFFWRDIAENLQRGLETLETLISTDNRRETDSPIIG
jgi:hypothetical protein